MIKALLFSLLHFLPLSLSAEDAWNKVLNKHDFSNFRLEQEYFSFLTHFQVFSSTDKIGEIQKKTISLLPHFEMLTTEGEVVAKAVSRFFSWGTLADVYDGSGNKIGWIQEQAPSWSSPCRFNIFDHSGQLVAVAKMNFWGTQLKIIEPSQAHQEIGLIQRAWLRVKSNWTVSSLYPEWIDPRLLIMIATYRTDTENSSTSNRLFHLNTQSASDKLEKKVALHGYLILF